MITLTKHIYGYETNPKLLPFGFTNNQHRINGIINDAGWFNAKGEKLGTGDLTLKDLQRISKEIPANEAFFALSDINSRWNLPSSLDGSAPGLSYSMQNATWLIVKGSVIRIKNDIEKAEEVKSDGILYLRIPRKQIYASFGYDDSGNKLLPKKQKPIVKDELKKASKKKDTLSTAQKAIVNKMLGAAKATIAKNGPVKKTPQIQP